MSSAESVSVFLNDTPFSRAPSAGLDAYAPAELARAQAFHRTLPGHAPTSLLRLERLAAHLGVRRIDVKDESPRFGLKAFKALGAAYAMARVLAERLGLAEDELSFAALTDAAARARLGAAGPMVFATATDGNHGRAVAWMARQLGQQAVVYLPQGASPERLAAIRAEGAKAEIVDMNYDAAVRFAARHAAERGWVLVQDTAWDGYATIPRWIVQGYGTLVRECLQQLEGERPTHVFIQAGVGSLAGAVQGALVAAFGAEAPRVIVAEARAADCLYRSACAGSGAPLAVGGDLATLMAGLACGEANPDTWPVLRDHAAAFASCTDALAMRGMRIYGNPLPGDPVVRAGESGAVTLGLLAELMQAPQHATTRTALGLDATARVLLVNTEGDTDPQRYLDIVWG